jgi:predicted transcriptional regulator
MALGALLQSILGAAVTGSLVLVAIPLVGRLAGQEQERLLQSALRRQIVELVRENPGIPIGELRKRLPVGWGTLYHHLIKLERSGLLRAAVSGRRRLLYPGDAGPLGNDPDARSILRGRTAQRLARAIVARPGRSVADIVDEMAESPRVIYYHLKRMLDAGLVTSSSETRYCSLTPTPRLVSMLAELGEPAA